MLPLNSYAQDSRDGEWISCWEGSIQTNLRRSENTMDLNTSVGIFQIFGTNIPEQALPAIESALDLWNAEINSAIPIKIQMTWSTVEGNFLAKTHPIKYLKNFTASAPPNIWYPIALAEKIARKELNASTDFEIEIAVNPAINWYYGTNGQAGAEEFDLMTIILHELAHGLGFVSSATLSPAGLSFSDDGYFDIYDQQLMFADFNRLSALNDDPFLLEEKTNTEAVFFLGEDNQLIKCYTQSFFLPSISLSHLDEEPEEPKLMAPYFSSGEVFHLIDESTLVVLRSIGWGERKPTQVTTYPNPTAECINFRLPAYLDELSIAVYNAQGQKILNTRSKSSNNALISMDIRSLDSGLYFFTLANTKYEFHQTLRVMVTR